MADLNGALYVYLPKLHKKYFSLSFLSYIYIFTSSLWNSEYSRQLKYSFKSLTFKNCWHFYGKFVLNTTCDSYEIILIFCGSWNKIKPLVCIINFIAILLYFTNNTINFISILGCQNDDGGGVNICRLLVTIPNLFHRNIVLPRNNEFIVHPGNLSCHLLASDE